MSLFAVVVSRVRWSTSRLLPCLRCLLLAPPTPTRPLPPPCLPEYIPPLPSPSVYPNDVFVCRCCFQSSLEYITFAALSKMFAAGTTYPIPYPPPLFTRMMFLFVVFRVRWSTSRLLPCLRCLRPAPPTRTRWFALGSRTNTASTAAS